MTARSGPGDASAELRQLARKHPGAFRKVATAADDDLRDRLLAVLDDVDAGGSGYGNSGD